MYSIMVVEDSKPIVRDIISKIQSIRPDIKEIVVTYDGVSALDMLKKQKPDILLTDIKMPMMDGLELISKAKEIYPELKCVVISGYGDFEFTHQALKLQVDEYILKPVDFEDFKRILQSLIYQIDQRRIVHQEEMFSNLLKGASEGEGMLGQSYMISVVRGKAILELTDLLTKKEIYQALEIKIRMEVFWWLKPNTGVKKSFCMAKAAVQSLKLTSSTKRHTISSRSGIPSLI